MFSKAKRFDPLAATKSQTNRIKKQETETQKPKITVPVVKPKPKPSSTPVKPCCDTQSQCGSVKSIKSFITPKPVNVSSKVQTSVKKALPPHSKSANKVAPQDDLVKAQEVEIRNKDYTISEYNKHIEELKIEIAKLHSQINDKKNEDIDNLKNKLSQITLHNDDFIPENSQTGEDLDNVIDDLKSKIVQLEAQCEKLEEEVSTKQVDLNSLEEIIIIRDSLCKDLQDKLTSVETALEETKQRLEMVNGHHALALEANESIRREYKAELETLKTKFEDEKLSIISKSKTEQEDLKSKFTVLIDDIKMQLLKEKDGIVSELKQQLVTKDMEMKAKLEQINEATYEKLRLCEIQFEERSRNLQEHSSQQLTQLQYLEKEIKESKFSLRLVEDQKKKLQTEVTGLKLEIETLRSEKENLIKETEILKEESKKKLIDFENKINKLTADLEKANIDKNKFQMSLSVTRDIVQVLTMRLRESDNELEHLENQVQTLTDSKESLENELSSYKTTLNTTVLECNEYKDALVNILKSKAALAKEHNRIMEHNVSLIESLQNVEKEAYRELGSIKNELIEDVELLKKESNSQIQMLKEEVEKKRMLCELATEHAGQATAAAEQSRVLLGHASAEIARLEADYLRLQQQIQDQQSLVLDLSLLRQENEELSVTVAKQSSIIDKMKKDSDLYQPKPKSPSVMRKAQVGKENLHVAVSPLRERNH